MKTYLPLALMTMLAFVISSPAHANAIDDAFNCDLDQVVLDLKQNPDLITARDDDQKWTLLIHAASGGCASVVKELIRQGADKNAKGDQGETALMVIILSNWSSAPISPEFKMRMTATVQELVNAKADLNIKLPDDWANEQIGASAAILAKRLGYDDIFTILKNGGADIFSATPFDGACGYPTADYLNFLKTMGFTISQKDCIAQLHRTTQTILDAENAWNDWGIDYEQGLVNDCFSRMGCAEGGRRWEGIKNHREAVRGYKEAKREDLLNSKQRNIDGEALIAAVFKETF